MINVAQIAERVITKQAAIYKGLKPFYKTGKSLSSQLEIAAYNSSS